MYDVMRIKIIKCKVQTVSSPQYSPASVNVHNPEGAWENVPVDQLVFEAWSAECVLTGRVGVVCWRKLWVERRVVLVDQADECSTRAETAE